jgi:hypothetical protein
LSDHFIILGSDTITFAVRIMKYHNATAFTAQKQGLICFKICEESGDGIRDEQI